MKTGFSLAEGALVPVTATDRAQILVHTAPDQDEKREVVQSLSMDPHDLGVDNQQCARQARIYSDVVSGLMDARGTIINNNVNTLLKKLTLINVIFLPLNLIASIGGMSESSPRRQGGASRSAVFTLFFHRWERFYPRFYAVISMLLLSCFLPTARWSPQ